MDFGAHLPLMDFGGNPYTFAHLATYTDTADGPPIWVGSWGSAAGLRRTARLAPTIRRPQEVLRDRLAVGPAELFAEKLSAFARAGVKRVFVWPVADEAHQLELFWETVQPEIAASPRILRSTLVDSPSLPTSTRTAGYEARCEMWARRSRVVEMTRR